MMSGATRVVVVGMAEPGTDAAISRLTAMGLDVLRATLPTSGSEEGRDVAFDDAPRILVYRNPWDVSEALQGSGAEAFLRRPEDVPTLWCSAHRHLLEVYRRDPERCVLLALPALLEEPDDFMELARRRLGLFCVDAPSESALAHPEVVHTGLDDPLPRLFLAAFPETRSVLRRLETAADRPSDVRAGERLALGTSAGSLRPRGVDGPGDAAEAPLAIVIPCRDHGPQLIEAIASVERSVPEPYELVVVDDGSTHPPTVAILDRLAEGGYRIERQGPLGVCAARNRGFEQVRARYVVPLDADNRLRPGRFLEDAVNALDADPDLGVVYGDRHEFGLRAGRVAGADFDLDALLRGNYIDTCAVVRWATWSDAGGYDEAIAGWEDWELWIRVARRGWRFRHLDQIAFDYRVRPGSLVTTLEDPRVLAKTLDHVVGNHREVFEPYLFQRLGHGLATWVVRLLEERDRLRVAPPTVPGDDPRANGPAAAPALEGPAALELARARLAVLEARRVADHATWRLEHAKASAEHFEQSARQLQDNLAARDEVVSLQLSLLDEVRNRAELAEAAYRTVKAEAVVREQALQQLDQAHRDARREVDALRQMMERLETAGGQDPALAGSTLGTALGGGWATPHGEISGDSA